MPRSSMADLTRRRLLLLGSLTGIGMLAGCAPDQQDKKPVLYLYPSVTTNLSVSLDYQGRLTYTYPKPQTQADGRVSWQVTASPDGDLTDASGRHYPSLFWEGEGPASSTQDEGFVVHADAATGFLEEKLSVLGLSQREASEFITFWGPRIAERGSALVTFATDEYARRAVYRFTDTSSGAEVLPETFIRVYVLIGEVPRTPVPEQDLVPAPARTGFTAVEWGGTEL
ncbi:transcriptional initiation protein Tat [Actinomyces sp. ZJ308]|uniref:transcriptional initiation protein Tat n=1 Tax=Actinomyces sp. ZJ308 TaxID=2708342 RepID=UPI00141D9590|nr:transcriptional initiation protein Tat [Actinomyces sp. ZJ308]